MNINLLPLFASNVFYFNIDEDTSELDPNHFEFLRLGGNNFASSVNAYSTASVRVLEKYPNRIPIIVNRKKDSNIADIGKSKLLVQKDMAMNQFIYVIRINSFLNN